MIDDEVEETIKKEVLTSPQCIEKKINDIKLHGDKAEQRNIVILADASSKPVKKTEGKKRLHENNKVPRTLDIRNYLSKEKAIRVNTMVFENSSRKIQIMKEEVENERCSRSVTINEDTRDARTEKALPALRKSIKSEKYAKSLVGSRSIEIKQGISETQTERIVIEWEANQN